MTRSRFEFVMSSRWVQTGIPLVTLALLVWTARFWHSGGFGLYEDDYSRIPDGMGMTWPQLVHQVSRNFQHLSDHGLPLHGSLILFLSHVSQRLGGLGVGYFIGYLLVAANTYLFYALLRRLHSPSLGLMGGVAYALFSADTTQAFLTHAFGLQPSMSFILLAFHSYLSKRRVLAFALAALTLFTYETVYPAFLAAPLLVTAPDRNRSKAWIAHAIGLVAILLAVTVLRLAVGESRVSGMNASALVATSLTHMAQGPLVSLGTYLYRPIQALASGSPEVYLAASLAFFPLAAVFSALKVGEKISTQELRAFLRGDFAFTRLAPHAQALVRLGLVGLFMLVMAYPLTLTVRGYAVSGRDTRVHFAAVLGASVIIAVLWMLLLKTVSAGRKRVLANVMAALLFSLLLGSGFLVQKDYVMAWMYQQEFWESLLPLVHDASSGTVILIDPEGLPYTRQIEAISWNVSRVLSRLYDFPASWEKPPTVYRLVPVWRERIITEDGLVRLNELTTAAPPSLYRTVESSKVILIETAGGHLRRRQEPLRLGEDTLRLSADMNGDLYSFPGGILYQYLIDDQRNRP